MLMSYIKSVLGEVTSENSPYHAIKSNLEDSNNIREKIAPFTSWAIFDSILCNKITKTKWCVM